ncbi:MAG: peptide transporter, partial [Fusobacterium periodonticum]|nr:peptide transporter [Fusobacterium periodonticum]
ARALVQEADIYLMDEPFQGVDSTTEKSIVEILKQLKAEGKTIIVVHHDLQTVPTYFESVALINKAVIVSGKVSEVFTSENIDVTYRKI